MDLLRAIIAAVDAEEAREIEGYLLNLGHQVATVVFTRAKAIEQANLEKPDLVLLDHNLIQSSSDRRLDTIIHNEISVPIIYLVDDINSASTKLKQSLLSGTYLVKPIRQRDLKIAMQLLKTASDEPNIGLAKRIAEDYGDSHLLQLFDSMLDAYALHDVILDEEGRPCDYRFLKINRSFEKITGLKREETIGRTALELIPDLNEYWIETYGKVALTGQSIRFDQYSAEFDKHFEVSAYRPQPGQFACIFKDISYREHLKKKIEDSEVKYRSLFEHSLDGRTISDTETGIVLDCNQAMADMVERSKEELIGQHQKIYHPPKDDNQLFTPDFAKQRLEKSGSLLDSQVLTKSGKIKEVSILASVFQLEGKQVIQGVFRDITDRKQAEKELANIKEFYLTILEKIHEGIWVTDEQDRLIYINPGMERIAGVSAESVLGKNIYRDFKEETVKQFIGYYHEAKTIFKPVQYISTVVTPAGRNTVQTGWLIPRQSDGKYKGMICSIQDITERIKAEEQIKSSLKEKETLLQEIHHRVKNNMQVVASLLKLQSDGSSHKEVKEALQESQNRVYAMAIVHESLYSSPSLSEINIQHHLNNLANSLYQSSLNKKDKVNLIVEIEDITINFEQASPLSLTVNELLYNAFKHAFPGDQKGEVLISLKLQQDNQIALVVKDDGVGLPPGFNWQSTDTLGLELVINLVQKQLDGSITLLEGPGTAFLIQIPYRSGTKS